MSYSATPLYVQCCYTKFICLLHPGDLTWILGHSYKVRYYLGNNQKNSGSVMDIPGWLAIIFMSQASVNDSYNCVLCLSTTVVFQKSQIFSSIKKNSFIHQYCVISEHILVKTQKPQPRYCLDYPMAKLGVFEAITDVWFKSRLEQSFLSNFFFTACDTCFAANLEHLVYSVQRKKKTTGNSLGVICCRVDLSTIKFWYYLQKLNVPSW